MPTLRTRSPQAPFIRALFSIYGSYLQDDWKATPFLTINAGVRYEYFSPTRDAKKHHRQHHASAAGLSEATRRPRRLQLGIQVAGATGARVLITCTTAT